MATSILPAGRDFVTSDSSTGAIGSGFKVAASQVTGLDATSYTLQAGSGISIDNQSGTLTISSTATVPATVVQRLVDTGSAWPSRPASGNVEWVNVYGTTTTPPLLAGDTYWPKGSTPTAPASVITAAQAGLQSGWSSIGSTTMAVPAGGPYVFTSNNNRVRLNGITVVPSGKYVAVARTNGGQAELVIDQMDSSWNFISESTSGAASGDIVNSFTMASNGALISIQVIGENNQTTNLTSVSLVKVG